MSRPLEAEQAVLGGLMLDPSAIVRVSDLLTAGDFQHKGHQLIFRAIKELFEAGSPYDAVTLGEWFESRGQSGAVQGGSYLIDLASGTPSAANIRAYAEIVAKVSETARVRSAGQRIALASTYAEGQALLADAAPRRSSALKSVKDGLGEMVESLQRRFDASGDVTGVPTGIASLDALTGGWQPGNLIIAAGRPGMGKSAFAVQAAIAAERALFVSLEMTAGELIERAVCNVGHIPNRWFRFPKEAPDHAMERIGEASKQVAGLRLSFDDSPSLNMDAIECVIRQAHMADPLRLIVVDHLGIIGREGKHDASELGAITARMKRLAKEIAPVLLLCQLNRGLESRTDKRPMLSDLRDSGRIEEDADMVIGMYRESYYAEHKDPDADYLELLIRKNRSGEQATAWALARLGEMRLESADEPVRHVAANEGGGGFAAYSGKGNQPRNGPRASSGYRHAAGGGV